MRWRNLALVALGAVFIAAAPKIDVLGTTSDGDTMKFLLRDAETVLFVSDVPPPGTPQIGGLAATPSVAVLRTDFEANCASYLSRYPDIVVDGTSECLERNRSSATTFVRDDTFTLGTNGFTLYER